MAGAEPGAIGLLSVFPGGYTLRARHEYIANGWTMTSVERLASMTALPADETLFVWGDEVEPPAVWPPPDNAVLELGGRGRHADPAVSDGPRCWPRLI